MNNILKLLDELHNEEIKILEDNHSKTGGVLFTNYLKIRNELEEELKEKQKIVDKHNHLAITNKILWDRLTELQGSLINSKNRLASEMKYSKKIFNEKSEYINSLENHFDNHTAKIEELEKDNKVLKVENESLKGEIEKQDFYIEHLESVLDEYTHKVKDSVSLNEEYTELKKGYETIKNHFNYSIKKNNKLKEEIQNQSKYIKDLEEDYDNHTNEIEELKKENIELEKQVEDRRKYIESLENDFNNHTKEIEDLENENKKLKSDNGKLDNLYDFLIHYTIGDVDRVIDCNIDYVQETVNDICKEFNDKINEVEKENENLKIYIKLLKDFPYETYYNRPTKWGGYDVTCNCR